MFEISCLWIKPKKCSAAKRISHSSNENEKGEKMYANISLSHCLTCSNTTSYILCIWHMPSCHPPPWWYQHNSCFMPASAIQLQHQGQQHVAQRCQVRSYSNMTRCLILLNNNHFWKNHSWFILDHWHNEIIWRRTVIQEELRRRLNVTVLAGNLKATKTLHEITKDEIHISLLSQTRLDNANELSEKWQTNYSMRVLSHVETLSSKRHSVRNCKYCRLTPKDCFSYFVRHVLSAQTAYILCRLFNTLWIKFIFFWPGNQWRVLRHFWAQLFVSKDLHQQIIPVWNTL